MKKISAASLLKKYNLSPRKSLGQNFLDDPVLLDRITAAAELLPEDTVLEIGPGLGGLTTTLAQRARRVVAVELDRQLIPALQEVCSPYENIQIVQGDILSLDPAALTGGEENYMVVANIPYNITSAIIRHLLEARCKPKRIVLTVQLEVAQRICASVGDYSLLALSVQVYGKPSIRMRIPAGAFYPAPNVDSAVVRVDIYPHALIDANHMDIFFRLARAGFSQKRKTLRNSLSAGLNCPASQAEALLQSAGINPQQRAQALSIEEWQRLVDRSSGLDLF